MVVIRKTAKEILAESFRELAEGMSIDKITVQDIVANCGYSPATFYRQYKDKYDLIAWEHTRGVAEIMARVDARTYPWRRTLLDGAKKFEAERDYLKNLFLHTSGQDSFVRYMTEINCAALEKYLLAVTGKENLSELGHDVPLLVRVYCLGTVALTFEWIMGDHDLSAEALAEVYENALPPLLRQYLLE